MTFSNLGLADELLRAVSACGYTAPTPIQTQAIPLILEGRDLLAGAQTGTGKTASFTLPILHQLATQDAALSNASTLPQKGRSPKPRGKKPSPVRALILTPTRELAAQVEESVQTYGQYLNFSSMTVFGGVNIVPQIRRLKGGVDILVATPGRLLDHINRETLDLSQIEILVLDEADRMLDMGFIRDIRRILSLLPKKRQNLLFSATFSDEIKALAQTMLKQPALIEVPRQHPKAELIEQKVCHVSSDRKSALLIHLIQQENWYQVLVFTRTKHGADRLAKRLTQADIPALAIHGNKSQGARTRTLAQFKEGRIQVLVATDIAARGIDISELPMVINYELPNVPEDYVHRIGRTGRAEASGEALSLVSADEKKYLKSIERLIKRSIPKETVEGFEEERMSDRPDTSFPNSEAQNRRRQGRKNASKFSHSSKKSAPHAGNKPKQRKRPSAKRTANTSHNS